MFLTLGVGVCTPAFSPNLVQETRRTLNRVSISSFVRTGMLVLREHHFGFSKFQVKLVRQERILVQDT